MPPISAVAGSTGRSTCAVHWRYRGVARAWQIVQGTIMAQGSGAMPTTAWADLGHRGVGSDDRNVEFTHRRRWERVRELGLRMQ